MIEVGQLRRWTDPTGGTGVFLVIERTGKFYRQGSRTNEMVDHWRIMADREIQSGWPASLLEELSEVIDGAQ